MKFKETDQKNVCEFPAERKVYIVGAVDFLIEEVILPCCSLSFHVF